MVTNPILRRLALLSALAPLVACGCADLGADDTAGQTKSTTSGDGTPGGPEKGQAEDDGSIELFTASEDADARLSDSVKRNADLVRDERQLAVIYQKLSPKLSGASLVRNLDTHDAALSELRKASRILREIGGEIIQAHSEFLAVSERYRNDLARAPISYRAAAECYGEKAKRSPDRMLQDQYMKLHDNCLAFARAIQGRSVAFEQSQAEVERLVEYTKRSVAFLRDLEDYTNLAPASNSAEYRKSYRAMLKVYVGQYAGFIAVHDRYSNSIQSQPLPSGLNLAATPPQPRPVSPVRTVASTWVAAHASYAPVLPSVSHATSLGKTYARLLREAEAEYPSVNARSRTYTGGEPLPKLIADINSYNSKKTIVNRYELKAVSGFSSLALASNGPLARGTHIPVIRDSGREFVGVIRVATDLDGNRYAVDRVSGDVRSGDYAVLPKGP